MGKPAARVGDMTSHGGVIAVGCPTVLIGGMPAARVGDMHTCPMVSPGPVPHVGGPVSLGSTGVLIANMPAARMGDMCVCTGPPDSIAAGCPTVLIGETGAGGGAGGGSGSAKSVAAGEASSDDSTAASESGGGDNDSDSDEGHFLHTDFVDKAGFPITGVNFKLKLPDGSESSGPMTGTVKQDVEKTGNYDIELHGVINAQWSKERAKVGDSVTMSAEAVGIDDGTEATLELSVYDPNYATRTIKSFKVSISGGKVQHDWKVELDQAYLQIQDEKSESANYSSPLFFFKVKAGESETRSGFLTILDDFEFNLKDKDGNPLGDKKYRLYACTGEIREGTLDGNGHAKETDVPAGRVQVFVDIKDEKFNN